MITIKRYNPNDAAAWDAFVDASKNGTFMLKRGYMDYHTDRFTDHSLLFYRDEELVALLPASSHGDELRSHGGLTYGGMITNLKMTVQLMLSLFDSLKEYMSSNGISRLIYKRVPSIYYSYPSDEDLYALFRNNAILTRRDISATFYLPNRIRFSERRRRGVKNAHKIGIVVRESHEYEQYIEMLSEILAKYHDAKPVHTAAELRLLADRFPDNIKMYAAFHEDEMLAGVVVYLTPQVAHTQYIANSDEGRQCGALDAVMDYLVNECYADKVYFDFGISNENEGRFLNEGLISQKQEFGGRAVAYDFYELKL
ncbi:MAG: GNAT family N-acetyltransferase [Alistipes sp.]|nr:GNAT family N-acetyltransferase [Alistipes sp.]MBR6550648.1 GNAT family N-acetyltransferase [Paludibacteraceae bacterium]